MRLKDNSIFWYNILILFLLGATSACNPQPEARDLLQTAQRLIDSQPDSSLRLLDSIFDPEVSLSKRQQMQYHLLRVQARYKNYRNIADDTLVFAARDYFVSKKEEPTVVAKAFFYSGCVYREQHNFNRAMQQYKNAEQYAAKAGEVNLQGLIAYNIGDLYFNKSSYPRALAKYKESFLFYADNPEKLRNCMKAIGQTFVLLNKLDSAFVYFDKGAELVLQSGNRTMLNDFYQNISVAYTQKGEYAYALNYLKKAFNLNTDSTEIVRYQLNFAQIYRGLGRSDSVRYYVTLLQRAEPELSDIHLKYSVNNFLAEIFHQKGIAGAAYTHLQKKDSCLLKITETSNVQAIAEIERKYDVVQLLAEKEEAKADSYKMGVAFLGILLILILLAGIFTYYWSRHKQEKKKNAWLREKTEKAIYINKVYQSGMNNIVVLKNKINNLATKYSIKEPGSNGYDEIVKTLRKMEAEAHLNHANYTKDFLISQLALTSAQADELKAEDQLLVSLLYCNYTHANIASILQITPHTLSSRKSRLKEKLLKAGISVEKINTLMPTK